MSFTAEAINVMVASPGDVATERQVAFDAVHQWNSIHAESTGIVLLPQGWETHASPEMGDRAQTLINRQVLERCDLLIAIFWTRLGSPTGEYQSGTVEELETHLASGKPAMIYFSNAPVHLDSVDHEQYAALQQFRRGCESRGLIEQYESVGDFKDKLVRQLAQTMLRAFSADARDQRPPDEAAERTPLDDLSPEPREILIAAAGDQSGTVLRLRSMSGLVVQTNGRQFVQKEDSRSEAQWESAIQELEGLGLLRDRGYKGEVYGVTNEGYRLADLIGTEQA